MFMLDKILYVLLSLFSQCQGFDPEFDYIRCSNFDSFPLTLSWSYVNVTLDGIETNISINNNGTFGTASYCESPEEFGDISLIINNPSSVVQIVFDNYVKSFSFDITNQNIVTVFCYDNQLFLPPILAYTYRLRPYSAPNYTNILMVRPNENTGILSCEISFGSQFGQNNIMLDNFCVEKIQ